jgi:alpha-1,3-glucosyltransferase
MEIKEIIKKNIKNKTQILMIILLVVILIKVSVSLGGYSGYKKGPKYGDYEAQRHWMEITSKTPLCEWYIQTPNNDLEYWGLDCK